MGEFVYYVLNRRQSQIILMDLLRKAFAFLAPAPVSCNEGYDSELPHDQAATDEDYSPIHTSRRRVPGFDHLLNPVLGITGEHDFIKGFKFDISFPVSEYFQLYNSWEIPNSGIKEEGGNMMQQMMMGKGQAKPTYSFMTQVARDVTSPAEPPGLMLMGKVDSEGRVDSIFLKRLAGGWNMKLSGNFMNSKTEDGALGADFEYEDSESAGILRFQHHPMQGLVASCNFMQRVHRNVMLGFDFTHLFAHKKQMFSYGGKFFIGNHALYASTIQGGMQYHLGYVIPIRKGTTFVSHYKFDPENGSTTTLGMRQRYDAADITATINSKKKLAAVLGLKGPLYGLKLCAEVDYEREHYSFGYGISIGPQQ